MSNLCPLWTGKIAVELLSQDYVNNLSGLDGSLEGTMYKRDSGRKAPHNAYTTGERHCSPESRPRDMRQNMLLIIPDIINLMKMTVHRSS